MYSIGDLSKKTGVKITTIRYYEQMGLLDEPERSMGNQRRYTRDGLERLSFIQHARRLGFSINDIENLIRLHQHPSAPCKDVHSIVEENLRLVKERIAKLRRLQKELTRIVACQSDEISDCAIIETLADHSLCTTEH